MPSQLQEMHTYHPSYMFNDPEVTNEYNLLNEFLNTSMLEDSTSARDEGATRHRDPSLVHSMASVIGSTQSRPNQVSNTKSQNSASSMAQTGPITSNSALPLEKAKETYYMTAADPSGADPPDKKIDNLLKAKYDAGLLKPFNYVQGYARLQQYMDQHMQSWSKKKILRQLNEFRPKFRERMQTLTDLELVLVEMWFERSLMEYDRIFASMAIPACCWRRTGEIYRGNKEMAELIEVPIESFRDVSLPYADVSQARSLRDNLALRGNLRYTRSSPRINSSVIGRSLVPLPLTATRKLCLRAAH